MIDHQVRPFDERDWPAVLELLGERGLPEAGLQDHRAGLIVALDGATVIGCAGLEAYGSVGLFRSLAVREGHGGKGLGTALTRAVLQAAAHQKVEEVYLLTETAERLFGRLGFATVGRDAVPKAIKGTVEFAQACPASATVMKISLPDGL